MGKSVTGEVALTEIPIFPPSLQGEVSGGSVLAN